MPEHIAPAGMLAIRGPVLTYTGNPFESGLEHTMVYEIRRHHRDGGR